MLMDQKNKQWGGIITKRAISPLRVGDEVEVMRWENNGLAVPLMQLELIRPVRLAFSH